MHTKRAFTLFLLLAALLEGGCYYTHIAAGQTRVLLGRRSTDALLADPDTPATLRERLELVGRVRDFARALGLEVAGQYTSFVDAEGSGIVTTVVATRPGELEAAGFWFPVVGRVPYKGYFDPALAEREANRLRERQLDVCVSSVVAYSTLGWFDDPLTGPMLRLAPGDLVETVLHELVHATIFAPGQPEFNEGLANFVGQEARVRYFEDAAGAEAAQRERARVRDDRRVAAQLAEFREAVAELYAREPEATERLASRDELEARARRALATLPLAALDASALARGARLNDACLALARAYESDLVAYEARLAELGGDLRAFLEAARRAAETDTPAESLHR